MNAAHQEIDTYHSPIGSFVTALLPGLIAAEQTKEALEPTIVIQGGTVMLGNSLAGRAMSLARYESLINQGLTPGQILFDQF